MKKIMTILCITCISVSAIAQSGVRIGNYEFFIKKAGQDSIIQVFVEDDPCPPCPSENEIRPKPKSKQHKYHKSTTFTGIGFISSNSNNLFPKYNSADYYTILGGKSMNLDFGRMHRYHLSRRFALGTSLQYSYYNYRLKLDEPVYLQEVYNRRFTKDEIYKQVFRSHNVAGGVFTRFYLVPPKNRGNDGLYLDLGAQGDFAFSKYCKLKTHSGDKYKQRDGEAFNPFSASAIARIGCKGWGWGNDAFAFFVRYRFTDAFNSNVLPKELPPITFGIQFH